jgi:hypothetical protein
MQPHSQGLVNLVQIIVPDWMELAINGNDMNL